MLSRVGSRLEAATGPLNRAPTQGAAAGLLRESGDDAAATASAVKFMLIESEAAATSASFLPAQFSRLFFLLSSQPIPPPPSGTRTQLRAGQGKNQESGAEIMLEGRERWTHSNPLNAQTVTMIHRAEQTQ